MKIPGVNLSIGAVSSVHDDIVSIDEEISVSSPFRKRYRTPQIIDWTTVARIDLNCIFPIPRSSYRFIAPYSNPRLLRIDFPYQLSIDSHYTVLPAVYSNPVYFRHGSHDCDSCPSAKRA